MHPAKRSQAPPPHASLTPTPPSCQPAWGSEDTQPHLSAAQVMTRTGRCLICAILGFVPAPSGAAPPHSQRQGLWRDPFAIALGNEDRNQLNQVSDLFPQSLTYLLQPPAHQDQTYYRVKGLLWVLCPSLGPGATTSMEAFGACALHPTPCPGLVLAPQGG